MASLKERKELFVSDLLGGSVYEIYTVTTVALTAYASYSLVKRYCDVNTFVLDFLFSTVPILLTVTLYAGRASLLHVLVGVPAVAVAVVCASAGTRKAPAVVGDVKTNAQQPQLLVKKPFLTAYRSHMLIITNLCIIAVDFNVFPRRFAKVETWGTSLMDLGVGSFVFSMGLVNSRSIIKQQLQTHRSSHRAYLLVGYLLLIAQNAVKSLPILALGLVRLVSVKSLEYQEHVSEYGIHWNFFFTLGFLPVVIGFLDPFLSLFPRALVAAVIGLGYEYALTNWGLLKFILTSDNRMDSVITQNKEGIFSFIGYLSIFIFGQSFGSFVLTNARTPMNLLWINVDTNQAARSKSKTKRAGLSKYFTVSTTEGLLIASVVYQLAFLYCKESPLFNNISRRVANFPYVLWVVSYNAALLLGYDIIEQLVQRNSASSSTGSAIIEATNNNGLVCFLLGNLLTGLINMCIDTLVCSNAVAFSILCAYSVVLSVIVVVLDKHKIYIKL